MKIAYFNRLTVTMPLDVALACSHPGPCDADVELWYKDKSVHIDGSPEDIRRELAEHGAWTAEELADDDQNRRRIVWIAAGDIREGE